VPDERGEDVQVPTVDGDRREELVGPLVALVWRERRDTEGSGGFGHGVRLDPTPESLPGPRAFPDGATSVAIQAENALGAPRRDRPVPVTDAANDPCRSRRGKLD
jgi:hypothetical protein